MFLRHIIYTPITQFAFVNELFSILNSPLQKVIAFIQVVSVWTTYIDFSLSSLFFRISWWSFATNAQNLLWRSLSYFSTPLLMLTSTSFKNKGFLAMVVSLSGKLVKLLSCVFLSFFLLILNSFMFHQSEWISRELWHQCVLHIWWVETALILTSSNNLAFNKKIEKFISNQQPYQVLFLAMIWCFCDMRKVSCVEHSIVYFNRITAVSYPPPTGNWMQVFQDFWLLQLCIR